jgi:hypothetical protein
VVTAIEKAIGNVFRHKRLFNYVISPISIEDGLVICLAGNDIQQEIPIDFFKRDWIFDPSIDIVTLFATMEKYPTQTPYTQAYNDSFEPDDGVEHCYLHFSDIDENETKFPLWVVTRCIKTERDKLINPFTMIMPIDDSKYDEVSAEIELINSIRLENNFMNVEDFTGFEFGLIKLLEKKYLRTV